MPLPTINNVITPPGTTALTAALPNHAPVTGGNEQHNAKIGTVTWNGNQMDIAGVGAGGASYWYIPASVGKVSYCVVPCGGGGDAYVISDQYGGCEYHELYNATFNELAFLHVYRGDGTTTTYTLGAGWVVRNVKRSSEIAQRYGMHGANWSVSLINLANATVQSKFLHVQGYPNSTVTGEDNGDTPYPTGLQKLAKFLFG